MGSRFTNMIISTLIFECPPPSAFTGFPQAHGVSWEMSRVWNPLRWASSDINLIISYSSLMYLFVSFSGGSVGKEPTCNLRDTGDTGSIPGPRRSPGGGHGNLPQFSRLENPIDRGAWRATQGHKDREAWQTPQGNKELDTTEVTQCAYKEIIGETDKNNENNQIF